MLKTNSGTSRHGVQITWVATCITSGCIDGKVPVWMSAYPAAAEESVRFHLHMRCFPAVSAVGGENVPAGILDCCPSSIT
jgi:hypothetical protein